LLVLAGLSLNPLRVLCLLQHRDSPPPDGWPTPHSRRIKAFCSFWDTPAHGGATAVVPMSHRTPAGPKDTLCVSSGLI